jgi:hypothetical protein
LILSGLAEDWKGMALLKPHPSISRCIENVTVLLCGSQSQLREEPGWTTGLAGEILQSYMEG